MRPFKEKLEGELLELKYREQPLTVTDIEKDIKRILTEEQYIKSKLLLLEVRKYLKQLNIDCEDLCKCSLLTYLTKRLNSHEHLQLAFDNDIIINGYRAKDIQGTNYKKYIIINNLSAEHFHYASALAFAKAYGVVDRDILDCLLYAWVYRKNDSVMRNILPAAIATRCDASYEGVEEVRRLLYTDFEENVGKAFNHIILINMKDKMKDKTKEKKLWSV